MEKTVTHGLPLLMVKSGSLHSRRTLSTRSGCLIEAPGGRETARRENQHVDIVNAWKRLNQPLYAVAVGDGSTYRRTTTARRVAEQRESIRPWMWTRDAQSASVVPLPDRKRPDNSDYVTSARVLMSQP